VFSFAILALNNRHRLKLGHNSFILNNITMMVMSSSSLYNMFTIAAFFVVAAMLSSNTVEGFCNDYMCVCWSSGGYCPDWIKQEYEVFSTFSEFEERKPGMMGYPCTAYNSAYLPMDNPRENGIVSNYDPYEYDLSSMKQTATSFLREWKMMDPVTGGLIFLHTTNNPPLHCHDVRPPPVPNNFFTGTFPPKETPLPPNNETDVIRIPSDELDGYDFPVPAAATAAIGPISSATSRSMTIAATLTIASGIGALAGGFFL